VNTGDHASVGDAMYALIADLYPICRSITGDGLRQTLRRLQACIPLVVHEVPTGTRVLDWTIPKEWNIRDAYVKNARGERVIDFRQSNLHVLNYSTPVRARMSLADLKSHLFSLPEHPDWIPYRTSYYQEQWGFCLSHHALTRLPDGEYDVCIDSTLTDGHLSYGECYVAGDHPDEILISCHACHPSLCNDNLSGVALAATLAQHVQTHPHRYSYRFLFIPGTIGSIAWLATHEADLARIRHGLVLANVGDAGPITYKRSRRHDAEIDRAVANVLRGSGAPHEIVDFVPWGYDERQFCSPGFDLPVGCFSRTPYGRFPEYHTSADDLRLVRPEWLADSFARCWAVLQILEGNAAYRNQNPKGEPQLGKRGLYRAIGGSDDGRQAELAMLWVLNLSDGHHSLLDISDRSGLAFRAIRRAADALLAHDLLTPS
jgi:aminopeptidase-like protein